MNTPTFRLPVGVECLSNNGKVLVKGPRGEVKFESVSTLYQKNNLLVFLPYLTSYQTSVFKQAVQGVTLGYTIELDLKGIGYKVHKEKNELHFFLGYSTPVIIRVPEEISVKINKKSVSLVSANFGKLQNFATSIRSYRFPDSYKGAGILYAGELITCKEGKKS